MAHEVKVPSLGESISSGILASWHVQSGDWVEEGDTLFELETDKITSEGMADVSGRIELKVEEGDEVEVGAVVALIDEDAEAETGGDAPQGKAPEAEAPASDAAAEPAPAAPDASLKQETAPAAEQAPQAGADFPASPAVRRLADESGIDPKTVAGSGKAGRVTKGDMLAAREQKPAAAAPAPREEKPAAAPKAAPAPKPVGERVTRKKMTPLRKRIAERLVQAQQSAAMLTTFNECNMQPIMDLRKKHQEAFVQRHGCKLGFMSFFVKAAVHALQTVPEINVQIEGDEMVQNHFYDLGVAMSTPRGLMVPVIRDADQKSFAQIEQDILDYAKKAKEGKITIDDLSGGVFTITNGGIFGSMLSTPILNQPQSGIMGMHAIQERPVAEAGQVVIRPMMYLALSYDHRAVDGREAVTFLVKIKEAIEDPARLLFGI